MAAWYNRYITMKSAIQGGAPIIQGTRTPVRSVVQTLSLYDGDLEEVCRALPHLSREEIDAALAYYRENPDAVDADIRRHEQALQDFLSHA